MPRGPRKLAMNSVPRALLTTAVCTSCIDSCPGFKDALARELRLAQRNNRYTVGEMFFALLYPMIPGLERVETTQLRIAAPRASRRPTGVHPRVHLIDLLR